MANILFQDSLYGAAGNLTGRTPTRLADNSTIVGAAVYANAEGGNAPLVLTDSQAITQTQTGTITDRTALPFSPPPTGTLYVDLTQTGYRQESDRTSVCFFDQADKANVFLSHTSGGSGGNTYQFYGEDGSSTTSTVALNATQDVGDRLAWVWSFPTTGTGLATIQLFINGALALDQSIANCGPLKSITLGTGSSATLSFPSVLEFSNISTTDSTAIPPPTGLVSNGNAPPLPPPTISSVQVAPATITMAGGGEQQFEPTVVGSGGPPQSVTWRASAGSIDATGLFTAPATAGADQEITITATSTADASKSGTATVTIPAQQQTSDTFPTAAAIAAAIMAEVLPLAPTRGTVGEALAFTRAEFAGKNVVDSTAHTLTILAHDDATPLVEFENYTTPGQDLAADQAFTTGVGAATWANPARTITAFPYSVTLASGGLDQVIVEPAANGTPAINLRQSQSLILADAVGTITGPGAASGTGAFAVLSPTGVTRMTGTMDGDQRTQVIVSIPA